jgi:hypothetical protein
MPTEWILTRTSELARVRRAWLELDEPELAGRLGNAMHVFVELGVSALELLDIAVQTGGEGPRARLRELLARERSSHVELGAVLLARAEQLTRTLPGSSVAPWSADKALAERLRSLDDALFRFVDALQHDLDYRLSGVPQPDPPQPDPPQPDPPTSDDQLPPLV